MSRNPFLNAVRAITAEAVGKKQPALAGLVSEWAEVVGAEWAARCVPNSWKQAKGADQAVLELAVSPGTAPIVQHELPVLEARINAYFGYRALAGLRLRQVEKLPLPARKAPRMAPKPLEIANIDDADLATALGQLGASLKNRKG